MVRKRSRKHYESDDNDSDSDFSLEDPRSQPAPKKYSLRQRKKALFIDDYDYEDDDEILPIPPTKATSDDEDFEVEREIAPDIAAGGEYVADSAYDNQYDDPSDNPNGLIDFEDMIRADIVVNKNRIDYDNMINKTEITIKPNNEEPTTVPVKSKRGRKPKKKPENEIGSSVLEPETAVQEDLSDKKDSDFNPDDKVRQQTVKVQKSVHKDVNEAVEAVSSSQPETVKEIDDNNLTNLEGEQKTITQVPECSNQNFSNENSDNENQNLNSQESVIKFNENYLQKPIQVNGTVLTTSEESESQDVSVVDNLEIEEEEDDDVVFVEDKRSEVIVLDD